jgi:HEAT repeat protein
MKSFFVLLTVGCLTCASFGADYEKVLSDLVPRLADSAVAKRYAAQMELQAIASKSSKPGNAAERASLGKALAAKIADATVPQPARVWMVRQLEYMGGAEAVKSLTQMLNGEDAELRECARRALEKNSARTASASLRAALKKGGDATWKSGLIHSLGQRGDAEAVSLIVKQLDDAATAQAAALALGNIATPAAVDALMPALGKVNAASEALIEAANRLMAKGNAAAAKKVYLQLYAPGNPVPTRVAALSGLTKVDPASAPKLIGEALAGNEPKLQQVAIQAAAKGGPELSRTLVTRLPQLPASAKAQVLGVLDATAEREIISCASDKDGLVRQAAIEALGRVGGGASVPMLLALASSNSPDKAIANAALAKISGPGSWETLDVAASQGAAYTRVVAMNALAVRGNTAAIPTLLKSAADADATVQKSALAALGKLGGDNEVEILGKMAIDAKSPEAASALETVASRVKDKGAAAKKLLALAGTDERALKSILDALSVLGGKESLSTMVKLTSSGDVQNQESAIRALSNWPDFSAVKPLLEIATNPNTPQTPHVLAIQGIARLIESVENEPAQSRAEAALAAMVAARRDEEKKQVISVLATVPHAKAVAAIKPLLADPKFKTEAGMAGASLAELLLNSDTPLAKDLATALKKANLSASLNRRADSVLKR